MNSSMFTADRVTHLKIVVVALIAATVVLGVGVSARVTDYSATADLHASGPALKAGKTMSTATREGVAVY